MQDNNVKSKHGPLYKVLATVVIRYFTQAHSANCIELLQPELRSGSLLPRPAWIRVHGLCHRPNTDEISHVSAPFIVSLYRECILKIQV